MVVILTKSRAIARKPRDAAADFQFNVRRHSPQVQEQPSSEEV